MRNQVLSIEQMRKLKELGVDTSKASMVCLFQDDESNIYDWDEVVEVCSEFGDCFHHFVNDDEGNNNRVYMSLLDAEGDNYDHSYREDCTVFTLQDIIELLPARIQRNTEYDLTIYKDFLLYSCQGKNQFAACRPLIFFNAVELFTDIEIGLIGAAYEMLVWVTENGYLKTK